MQDIAVAIGQYDTAPKPVERFSHARSLDGADVEHVADGDCATEMRKEKLPDLDLAISDGAAPLVASDNDFREMQRRIHQELMHDVDDTQRLQAVLNVRRTHKIVRRKPAGSHKRLVQGGSLGEPFGEPRVDLGNVLLPLLEPELPPAHALVDQEAVMPEIVQ
jgi:hypothetical protein